jgi:multisubunit Na+/H+ antiporter MnhB subunit
VNRPEAPIERSLILDVGVQLLFHSILLLSLYLLVAGHNHPGGGFIGGLVCAGAFGLRYAAGGIDELRAVHRLDSAQLLGGGLLLAAGTASASLLLGEQMLDHGYLSREVPVLGQVSVSSSLPFDVGVYLVVVGLVLMVLEALGAEIGDELPPTDVDVAAPKQPEQPEQPEPGR